jgi:peptidoglycan hydrolase-like protein with peptidoglycan-binding domain
MTAASGSGSTLKKGSQGHEVRELQTQLNGLGYALAVDGDFGDGTHRAVSHLQKAFGYTVDGVVGDGTRFLINQQAGLNWRTTATSAQLKEWNEVLKQGSSGSSVRALQQKLNQLGYPVTADGAYGTGTVDAVKHLQKSFGYTIDGIVGEGTHALIHQQTGLGWRSDRVTK